ncbi:MAG: protein phosphatase 2C domain-containing protein, partial [Myxococcota bacterium]
MSRDQDARPSERSPPQQSRGLDTGDRHPDEAGAHTLPAGAPSAAHGLTATAEGFTETGRRSSNQDAYLAGVELFAVADGMGGYVGGEIASSLALEALQHRLEGCEDLDAIAAIKSAFQAAQHAVVERSFGALSEMGTTLSAIFVRKRSVLVAHVGDSRVYRYRKGRLRLLTVDHTVSQLLSDHLRGARVPSSTPGVWSGVLTRCIGSHGGGEPDVSVLAGCVGDRFLLTTDGLDVLTHEQIEAMMANSAPRLLVEAALEA